MGSNTGFLHFFRTALIAICCFSSGSFSTGFPAQPDPEHIICILPVATEDLPPGVLVALFFDYPVNILHSTNLDTGNINDSFEINEQALTQEEKAAGDITYPVLIEFSGHPVPVCTVFNRVEESHTQDKTTFSKSGVNLNKSNIILPNRQISFSEVVTDQNSNNTDDTTQRSGLSVLSIYNYAGITEATMHNIMVSSTGNILFSSFTRSSGSLSDPYFDNLSALQMILLAALNARFNKDSPLKGINYHFFQQLNLNFAEGVPECVLHALMSLSERRDAFREIVLNENYISDDSAIQTFLTDWYQALNTPVPHQPPEAGVASVNQHVVVDNLQQLVCNQPGFVAGNLEEISDKMIQTVALSHYLGKVNGDIKPRNFLIVRNGEIINIILDHPSRNPVLHTDNDKEKNVTSPENTDSGSVVTPEAQHRLQMLDFKMLAASLLFAAMGIYMDQGSNDSENGNGGYSPGHDEISVEMVNAASLASKGPGLPTNNISSSLDEQLKEKFGKGIIEVVPAPLASFIVVLIYSASTETGPFIPLRLHSLFNNFSKSKLKGSTESRENPLRQPEVEEGSIEILNNFNTRFAGTMTVHYVRGDGNCLPVAVAEALNTESSHSTLTTQEDVRKFLVQKFRSTVDLIDSAPLIRSAFDVTDDRPVSQIQQDLREELANLMSLDRTAALGNIRNDGSNSEETLGTNWLETGLLAFLPLIGITVNFYTPLTTGTNISLVYDRNAWETLAPRLLTYLEQNDEWIPAPAHFVHLVHNGQSNLSAHYYFATPNIPRNNTSGSEITSDQLPSGPELPQSSAGISTFFSE